MARCKKEVALAVLSAAEGGAFTPTQIQKALFLISENAPYIFEDGVRYNFAPYNYGPFDASVYKDLEALSSQKRVAIAQSAVGHWKEYSATPAGIAEGKAILSGMKHTHAEYVSSVAAWVRSLTFEQLVKSIYDKYPEMRVNSIFKG